MHDAAYTTRIRKPKRRAQHSSAAARARTRTVEVRDRAVTRGSSSSTPTEHPPTPEPNPAPKPHVWVAEDIIAVTKELCEQQSLQFDAFFGASHPKLPPQLQRKSRADVIALLRRLATCADSAPHFELAHNSYHTFIAVLAAELSYISEHKHRRDAAMSTFSNARSDRLRVQRQRAALVAETAALTDQMRVQRAKRARLNQSKNGDQPFFAHNRHRIDELRLKYNSLREQLCKAKLSELEARRRLDRLQLKISAMLGDVIIPTLDTLSDSQPLWLADSPISLLSALSQRGCDQVEPSSKPRAYRRYYQHSSPTNCDHRSPASSQFVGYDAILTESKEDQQLRLLKYRLRMCEMETVEWSDTLAAEQERIRLVSRSRARLEEDVHRQKQNNREAQYAKPTASATRTASKSSASANAKTIAKIRSAVRASVAAVTEGSGGATKSICKNGRKGRARRSLAV